MGYRSDVRAIIYGPTDVMQRFVTAAKLSEEYKQIFTEFFVAELRIFTVNAGASDAWSVLEIACEDVKWYEDYPDVKMWHSFMRSVEDEDDWKELNYEFVRIGEEDGDVEYARSCDCDYILSVTRPTAEVDITRSHMTEGFPDETDQSSTGQE